MANILPSAELVTTWSRQKTVEQQTAYEQYITYAQTYNPGFGRFMPYSIPWESYSYSCSEITPQVVDSAGYWLGPLEHFIQQYPVVWAHTSGTTTHPVECLANAVYTRSWVLYIPAGYTSLEPIAISSFIAAHELSIEKLYIMCDSYTSSTVLVTTHVELNGLLVRSLTVSVGASAQLVMVHDKRAAAYAYSLEHIQTLVASHGQLAYMTGFTAQGNHSMSYYHHLDGAYAQVSHVERHVLTNGSYSALESRQIHQAADTNSVFEAKSLVLEQSRSWYQGTIRVAQEAARSVAHQHHKALLIGAQARNCASPALEIQTHQVQCTHGTATGSVDPEQMWHLQLRGLAYNEAQKLIIRGFITESPPCSPEIMYHRTGVYTRLQDCII